MSGESSGNATMDDIAVCPSFDTEQKCLAAVLTRRILAIISIISCIFILFVLILLKKYKCQSQRLVLYLTVAVILNAIHYAWIDYTIADNARGDREGYVEFCKFQGWYHIFTAWIVFLWLCFITMNITIATYTETEPTKRYEIIYFFITVTLSAVISIVPFFVDAYGPAGVWCWISSRRDGEVFRAGYALQFSLFYAPWIILCFAMAITLTIDFIVMKKKLSWIKNQTDSGEKDIKERVWKEIIRPLFPYPIIFIATFIFPFINRLRLATTDSSPASGGHFALFFLHAVSLTLPGIFFGVVVAIQYWKELKEKFSKKEKNKQSEVHKMDSL